MADRDPFLLTPYDGGGGVFNRLRVSSFFITNTHSPAAHILSTRHDDGWE